MRTIKQEFKVYSFSELNTEAQRVALAELREQEVTTPDCWYEHTIEDFKNTLESVGFYDVEVSFSGFCSQGDGASFTGRYSYEKGALLKVKKEYPCFPELHALALELQDISRRHFYSLTFDLTRNNHRYCHENTVGISNTEYGDCKWVAGIAEVEIIAICRVYAAYL